MYSRLKQPVGENCELTATTPTVPDDVQSAVQDVARKSYRWDHTVILPIQVSKWTVMGTADDPVWLRLYHVSYSTALTEE